MLFLSAREAYGRTYHELIRCILTAVHSSAWTFSGDFQFQPSSQRLFILVRRTFSSLWALRSRGNDINAIFFSVLITDNSCTQYLRPVRLRKIRIVICAMRVCYFSFSTPINDINGNKTRNKTGIVHRELKGVNQQILNTVLTHIHYRETN